MKRVADRWIKALSISALKRSLKIVEYSGGNQQKVVVAKSLAQEPSIVIFDEPTRGVDVSAIPQIHAAIRKLAAENKAVVVISSYLPEILAHLGPHSGRARRARSSRRCRQQTRPKTRSCTRRSIERGRESTILERPISRCRRVAGVRDAIATEDDGRLLSARIADEIRSAVLSGEMRPGMRIRQELLAAKYGASRIPVREALKQLENEGLVVTGAEPGRLDRRRQFRRIDRSLQDPRGRRAAGDFRERAEPDRTPT